MSSLAEQPPPRKGAKPGFYPDPLGSRRARWWDGASWTPRIGLVVPAGAPQGKAVPPPTKRCRHCGVESETFDQDCPNCGRSYGTSRSVIVAAVIAACLAGILLLGGCAVLVGVALNEAKDEIDESAITRAQYESIQLGVSERSVRARLGDPLSEESFNRPRLDCLYYARDDGGILDSWDFEFCFRGDVLYSKSVH